MAADKMIVSFLNEETTTINYSESMRERFGDVPIITVHYWDGEKFQTAVFVSIRIQVSDTGFISQGSHLPPIQNPPTISKIIVSHGGASTGFVKIH